MFQNFDPALLEDSQFKEDSVREVIITPILARLGYSPSGPSKIIRSKTLKHPFIYVGTRKHPVTIIPDYILIEDEKTLLVLDAKAPTESVLSRENVQQAYSYAIHPEIRSQYFALCNGRALAVFDVAADKPLLVLSFHQFEAEWPSIERHLSPRYLKEPHLRKFAPDLGSAIAKMGVASQTRVSMLSTALCMFARVDDSLITASSNLDFAGAPHMVSFDFSPQLLPEILAGLPDPLRSLFTDALNRSPFIAYGDLMIEIDFIGELGPETTGQSEMFRPIVIKSVQRSRFNPNPDATEPTDIPSHIFRLSKSFRILRKDG